MTDRPKFSGFEPPPRTGPAPAVGTGVARGRPGRPRPPTLSEALAGEGLTTFDGAPLDLPALEIGERIRMARQSRGLTQSALADRAGLRQADLSDIERGRGRDGPRYATLRRLAEALDVPLPLNPHAAAGWEAPGDLVTILDQSRPGGVLTTTGSYAMFEPLLSPDQWSVLRRHVSANRFVHGVQEAAAPAFIHACHLVRIEPGITARLGVTADLAVVAEVRGAGEYHVSGAVQRWPHPAGGARRNPGVALLDPHGVLQVSADPAEGLTLMMAPSAVFWDKA